MRYTQLQMSKANDRALASQLRTLQRAFRENERDQKVAQLGYEIGAYTAFRITVDLIAARDRLKALAECGRLLDLMNIRKCPPDNPPK